MTGRTGGSRCSTGADRRLESRQVSSYAPVRGCIVVRPYGFALWEHVRDALDRRIKETGHENIYLPLLVPESLLETPRPPVPAVARRVRRRPCSLAHTDRR